MNATPPTTPHDVYRTTNPVAETHTTQPDTNRTTTLHNSPDSPKDHFGININFSNPQETGYTPVLSLTETSNTPPSCHKDPKVKILPKMAAHVPPATSHRRAERCVIRCVWVKVRARLRDLSPQARRSPQATHNQTNAT